MMANLKETIKETIPDDTVTAYDPWTAAVRDELASSERLHTLDSIAGSTLELRAGRESLWLAARRPSGGGTAFRLAYAPGGTLEVKELKAAETALNISVQTALGTYEVKIEHLDNGLLHWTTRLTPGIELLLPYWPRDVYPFDSSGDPRGARGTVHAAQPQTGAAVLFLTQTDPAAGSLLYLQNLTELNPLLQTLGATPKGLVGGQWPHLGLALPVSETPLPGGREVVVSDAFVRLTSDIPADERQAAALFLDSLAAIYPHLPQPETHWHDWPRRSEETLHALTVHNKCLVTRSDHTFALPYLDAEEPDNMVQLALMLPLGEYGDWAGRKLPLRSRLRAGVSAFYDGKLGAMRRYLPATAGKDMNEVDSWYLYHPLLDLARLAEEGDDAARTLLLDCLEHGIKAARHFQYRWPIKFHLETLETLTDVRKPNEPGQSDVGGLYAAVMLRAWKLTGQKRYFAEAEKAVRAMSGYRFAVGYQFNITAIGAVACLRLWQETGDDFFRDQSFVLLASFFQHTTTFSSEIGAAKFFPSFFGVLCLHDAEYTAVFEAFESFCAFHEIMQLAGNELPASVQMLVTEYCRHLLNRAWFYYPSELPQEALATEIRNGHLDRTLAIPMEDLYPGGDPAGAVGQEVYGAGAAFAFVTRAFHRLPGVPFLIYCDYPLAEVSSSGNCVMLRVQGAPAAACRVRLIPDMTDGSLPAVTAQSDGHARRGHQTPEGHQEYTLPGGGEIEVRWP